MKTAVKSNVNNCERKEVVLSSGQNMEVKTPGLGNCIQLASDSLWDSSKGTFSATLFS